jgi:hypothetical protein
MKIQSTTNGKATIHLDGNEIATAIDAYLVSQRVYVSGPRTITANDTILSNVNAKVFVEGSVVSNGATTGQDCLVYYANSNCNGEWIDGGGGGGSVFTPFSVRGSGSSE